MKADVLVAEIGSTTTVVNAFTFDPLRFAGQGQAATSVLAGDVRVGLRNAVADLERNLGEPVEWGEMLAASSAAGGLKMCVHGLVYDMTVRAAKEAALGAGAVLKFVTAGKLMRTDIARVREQKPNIILVAGGVDYGERETAVYNFEKLADACPDVPFIYAGNIQNREEIALIAAEKGVKVTIAENVYPSVDVLNVEPTRAIIQDVFEEHIVHAPGMAEIRQMVRGRIMPTPGAVMAAAKLLYDEIGDLAVFDVGGATTDLHSVTEGSTEISELAISPEPMAKRTVEGDLGVYVNIAHIVEKIGLAELEREFPNAAELIAAAKPIPETDAEIRFIERLTAAAVSGALERHAGRLVDFYGPAGKKTVALGKDLTAVKYIVGTGGALTRLPNRVNILKNMLEPRSSPRLGPRTHARVLIDNSYIMASLGVLSAAYGDKALELMKQSIGGFS
ncbi:MAG: GlmL-related ornithine degradation protein [Defluviitaleaceae bacterium]|nr:GlmL-related ornithine degradation protein [Defluviitaleaceae bacterium]MCL2837137.1 GlmL-related ornithine degradation protein [Defluviitaleaceae bacterium]